MAKVYKLMRVYEESLQKLKVISAIEKKTMTELIAEFADSEYKKAIGQESKTILDS